MNDLTTPRRIRTGLVSVTFRKLSWTQVLAGVCDAGIESIEWGGDVHVFNWLESTYERQPLAEARGEWTRYLEAAGHAGQRFASLEFVKDDSLAQFNDDAKTLRELVDDANRGTRGLETNEVR